MSARPLRLVLAIALSASAAIAVAGPATAEPIGGAQLVGREVIIDPGPDAAALPDIAASTWVLADLDTGAILAAKGPHIARPPASVLKTLTALTLMPRLAPDTVYTATRDDVLVEGSRVGLVDGATYTVKDLFQGLFMQSGNDCASALANLNGGVDKTMAEINAEAERLQAYDTVAVNPSGLPADGQVTSAYDLALVAREGLRRDDYFAYANTKLVEDYPGYMPEKPGDPRPTIAVATQNPLFIQDYPGAIGLKTGWTTEAGRTFVGAADQDGHRLVVALMNITSEIYDAAAPLLDWGFANEDLVTPIGYLVDPVGPAADGTMSGGSSATASDSPSAAQEASDGAGDDAEQAGAVAAPSISQASSTSTVGTLASSGWAWGLLAAMAVGLLLVLLGIRSLAKQDAPPPRRSRRTADSDTLV